MRLWLLLMACVLAIASAGGFLLLSSGEIVPSSIRNPITTFVSPGVSLWWFVLGGPFQSAPHTRGGIAFAAIANAILWLVPLWLVLIVIRRIRQISKASSS